MMKNRSVYRQAFERNCFRLVIEAYQISLIEKTIQLDWNENDISYELYEKMETNPTRAEKYKIHISPEYRIPKDVIKIKGFADRLPRADLKMSHFALKQEFKYFFEAKKLKEKNSDLKRAYINDGMDRFICEKYPIGCMLGYLLEGKPDETKNAINSLLEKDGRSTEILHFMPNKLFQYYYESNHSQIGILKHLILDFSGNIAK